MFLPLHELLVSYLDLELEINQNYQMKKKKLTKMRAKCTYSVNNNYMHLLVCLPEAPKIILKLM